MSLCWSRVRFRMASATATGVRLSTSTSGFDCHQPGAARCNDVGGILPDVRFALRTVVVMLVLGLLTSPDSATGEIVFHRRDHADQGQYSPSQPNFDVRSYTDALQYLHKYGYLENCTLPLNRRRRRRQLFLLPSSGLHEGGSASTTEHECSDAEVQAALRRLQQRFELETSGRLDEQTRLLMSRGRCGNTDSDDKVRQRQAEPSTVNRTIPDLSTVTAANSKLAAGGMKSESGTTTTTTTTTTRAERGRRPHHKSRRQRRSATLIGSIVVESRPDLGDDAVETAAGGPAMMRTSSSSGRHVSSSKSSSLAIDTRELFERTTEHAPSSSPPSRQEMLRAIVERRRTEEANHQLAISGSSRRSSDFGSGSQLSYLERQRLRQHRRKRRRRRSINLQSFNDNVHEGPSNGTDDKDQLLAAMRLRRVDDSPVQWRLLDGGVSGKIPLSDQRAILELAFRMWSEVIPLKFSEKNIRSIQDMDVVIAFAKQDHMNCDKPFDGHGGELAHSWTGGDIHFDEDENYRRDDPSGSGINLLKVAVHEIGHVLGLLHNDRGESIMYPIYINPAMYDSFELGRDDRRAVQDIYGVCKGSFDVVFDWLRKVRSTEPNAPVRYIFNTYFFRGRHYWMYENRYNRTRYGDPLHIAREWTGLPGTIDAYVQVISSSGDDSTGSHVTTEYLIDTYFFSGDSYYKYDDDSARVAPGYPRKIAADFGPKEGSTETIPNNLDSVLFDNRDSLLYFFKGQWVWVYNPREIGRNGCCERKVAFSTLFPTATDASGSNLTGSISSVFYSYHFRSMFVFAGETVYENVAYDERTPNSNRLQSRGPWYNIWYDICDVD